MVVKNNAYHYGLEFFYFFLKMELILSVLLSLKEAIKVREIAPDATIFLMNAVYDFEKVRHYQIQMTLPSLAYYYKYKNDLSGIKVHLEFENLLHRSGFRTLEEIRVSMIIILTQMKTK